MIAIPVTLHIQNGSSVQTIERTFPAEWSINEVIASLYTEGTLQREPDHRCLILKDGLPLSRHATLDELYGDTTASQMLMVLVVPELTPIVLNYFFQVAFDERFFSIHTAAGRPIGEPPEPSEDDFKDFEDNDRNLDLQVSLSADNIPSLPQGSLPPSATHLPSPRAEATVKARQPGSLGVMPRRTAERRATVRYYERMNPEHVFPLLVALTRAQVAEIVQKHVAQKETGPFRVSVEEMITIEPVLPGCTCHPARTEFRLSEADQTITFWVVPHVLGQVKGATVTIRQDGRVLAEVPLAIKVKKQTAAVIMGCFSLVVPFLSSLAKRFGIDFEKDGNFDLFLKILNTLLREIPPVALFGAAAAITVVLFMLARPRKRDLFWDLDSAASSHGSPRR